MSDRENDALIAERLFRWRVIEGREAVKAYYEFLGNPPKEEFAHYRKVWVKYGEGFPMACDECGNLPEFSTDPAASKQLRAKLAEMGYTWRMELLRKEGHVVSGVAFTIFKDDAFGEDERDYQHQRADTEERAVVNCALAMLEKQS